MNRNRNLKNLILQPNTEELKKYKSNYDNIISLLSTEQKDDKLKNDCMTITNTYPIGNLQNINLSKKLDINGILNILFNDEDKLEYWFIYQYIYDAYNKNNNLDLQNLINISKVDLESKLQNIINIDILFASNIFRKYKTYNGQCFYPHTKNNYTCNFTKGTSKQHKCDDQLVTFINILCDALNKINSETYVTYISLLINKIYLLYASIIYKINKQIVINAFYYVFYIPPPIKQIQRTQQQQYPDMFQLGGYIDLANNLDKKTKINRKELYKLLSKYGGPKLFDNKQKNKIISEIFPI